MEVEVSSRQGFAALAVLVLVLAACGTSANQSSRGASEGTSDGIAVHGQWIVEVVNADGSLEKHVEFENALAGGIAQLPKVLSGDYALSKWGVGFAAFEFTDGLAGVVADDSPCLTPTGTPSGCGIWEGAGTDSGSTSYNLETTASAGAPWEFVLRGSHPVQVDGRINAVSTWVGTCPLPDYGLDCSPFGGYGTFSRKNLDDPDGPGAVLVMAGQMVQVEVRFSFS